MIINSIFSFEGLAMVTLLLGMRHGLDVDHLAMIDAIVRRLSPQSHLSTYVGFLFSLGHGIIVMAFCALTSILIHQFTLSMMLNNVMLFVSIFLLISFGMANIIFLIKTKNGSIKMLFMSKIFFKKNIFSSSMNVLAIMVIGAIFAISFDTVSQVALFSFNSENTTGIIASIVLGGIFTFGMILTDGLNGYVISRLVGKSQRISYYFSYGLSLMVGLFSLGVGSMELIRLI